MSDAAKIAEQFLRLRPEAREVYLAKLAESPPAAEIIPILEHFHKKLLEE
jgi:hypothetical protein